MPRYKLTIAYEGTDFHGWQKQATGTPDGCRIRTVQDVVEEAVRTVVREPVRILGASRTDAGVHARGQIATFAMEGTFPRERMADAINSRLPHDVLVVKAEVVADAFNPIGDCIAKGYRYWFTHGAPRRPLFRRRTTFFCPYRLDPVRMNLAARQLVGEHDFASFTRIHHGRESTVRTIFDCRVTADTSHRCRLDVCGNGFLYNMVRIIAGTLVEVGRGRCDPESIPGILAATSRDAAGPTLPPEGLFLMWVRYGEGIEGRTDGGSEGSR